VRFQILASDFFESFDSNNGYYMALMILYFLKDDPKYSTISEMVYLLDKQNFLNLVQYYGGQEIYVPEKDEIMLALKTILLYQYRVINKMPWSEALIKAGFNPSESHIARGLYISLEQVLEKTKIGDSFLKFVGLEK